MSRPTIYGQNCRHSVHTASFCAACDAEEREESAERSGTSEPALRLRATVALERIATALEALALK